MSSFEIFGVVSFVPPGVINFTKNHFGMTSNAPHQIKRLQRILEHLQSKKVLRKADREDQERINLMINECTDLLEANVHRRRRGSISWEIFWPADAEAELERRINALEMEANRVIAIVGLASEPTAPATPRLINPPTYQSGSGPSGLGTTPSPVELSPVLSAKRVLESPLGEPVYPKTPDKTKKLPVTLILEDTSGEPVIEPLRLHIVTVVERDESDQLIRYESETPGNKNKDPVPRQCIRFEDDKLEELNVSFLDRHYITVKNAEGYKVYKAHTTYKFDTVPAREEFLVQVRERTLLGPFFAVQVYHRGNMVAQDKVVRFWKKSVENVPSSKHKSDITVSFLGRSELQYELSLKDFHRSPAIERGNKVVLISRADGKRTEFVFRVPDKETRKPKEKRRLSFRKLSTKGKEPEEHTQSRPERSDAERFKAIFEANHPLTSTLKPAEEAREIDAGPVFQKTSPFTISTAGSTTSGSGGMTSSTNTSPDLQEEPVSPGTKKPKLL